jgi:predicted DNA-binding mobile mystery protein A
MTGWELAMRMGVSQSRISQIEASEIDGSLEMRTLQRVAEALNCRLHYVLVPQAPLESMVREQAEFKATIMVTSEMTKVGADEDGALHTGAIQERVDELADVLSERRGLWSPMFSFRSQRESSADDDAEPDTREDEIEGIKSEAQAPLSP